MSRPRPIIPGSTYLITRRCLLRRFFLRPSTIVNRIILYCLAIAAHRYGMQLHAICMMSNHYHLVLTDPGTNLPEFMRWFNEFVAKSLNAQMKRWESFWGQGTYSAVRLENQEAVIDKICYTLSNPVLAGLVAFGRHWPGLRLGPEKIGMVRKINRPKTFFRSDGPLPDHASLEITQPLPCSEMTSRAFTKAICSAVKLREKEARRERAVAKRPFLGRRAVLAQNPNGCPNSIPSRHEINPRFSTGSNRDERRIARGNLLGFFRRYREAWMRFKEGIRDVVFPAGTYALRIHSGVACESPC
jgi:putative transposase